MKCADKVPFLTVKVTNGAFFLLLKTLCSTFKDSFPCKKTYFEV